MSQVHDRHGLAADPSNAGQLEAWDGAEGDLWSAHPAEFDEAVRLHHRAFVAAASVASHERVLDVGCGNGRTTRDAARAAVDGSALGVDLSSQMLATARRMATDEGLANVEFLQADAQIHPFAPATFDVAVSRMGAMFFGDPRAAFANIRASLRPGGRLVLLAWQGLADNEWLTEIRAAMAVGRTLPTPPPDGPSPFALADPDRVRAVLGTAGFAGIEVDGLTVPMTLGPDPEAAFAFFAEVSAWMRDGLSAPDHDAALTALRASIDAHTGADGVTYGSAAWIIRATVPVP